jgi:hypothetical protein
VEWGRRYREGACGLLGEFCHLCLIALSSFPDMQLHIVAPLGTGPESILTIVVMDSGLARFTRAPE